MSALLLATARSQIADYVQALLYVYTILIFAYIVVQLLFAFGARPGYSRPLNAVLEFLQQVVEPYLRIFRRFIPSFGPLDFSPIIAVFVLQLVGNVVVSLIRG